MRRGWRVSCCCRNKTLWAWRRIRCLLRRKTTAAVAGRQCCSRTQGKEGDMIHEHGWKLAGKWDKWAGLLIDQLRLADELSREKVLLEEKSSRSTSSSRMFLNVSLFYIPTFWLPWSRNPRDHYLVAKQSKTEAGLFNNHDSKTTNSFWINYWPLSAGERAPPGSRPPRDTAVFFGDSRHGSPPSTFTTGSKLIFPLNRLTDWRKSCKWWEVTTSA